MTELFASFDGFSLDNVLNDIGDAVCVTDRDMVFLGANMNFAKFYGLDHPQKIIGQNALQMYPDFKKSVFYEACERTARTGEITVRHGYSMGQKRWVVIRCYQFAENRFAMVVHQISDNGKASYGANVDQLTSLPNRWAFEDDAQKLQGDLDQLSLMLIDISHFSALNEKLGFAMGDRCLMEIGARIQQHSLPNDRVYRMGNDQFMVFGGNSETSMIKRAQQLQNALAEPLHLNGEDYLLQCYIGACSSKDTKSPADLLAGAEFALSKAKQTKTGYVEHGVIHQSNYDPALTKQILDAIQNDELFLVYQPQVDLLDYSTCSAEALVRWQHPTKGFLSPAEFLPFAEETGLIGEIDKMVAQKTIAHIARLQKRGITLPISFNLSAKSLCDVNIIPFVQNLINENQIEAKHLGIEITETSLMHDVKASQYVIEQFKNMGLHVSIDDFGSGYSSMAYLLRYPSHFLKIDRDFISDLHNNESNRVMVRNMVGLSHGMGIGVVAEGVETEEDAKTLKQMGCDVGQGYFFSKPLTATDLDVWLEAHPATPFYSLIQ